MMENIRRMLHLDYEDPERVSLPAAISRLDTLIWKYYHLSGQW